ncbi:MAG: hypothetical protein ACLPKI_20825 [Streptosporangiaceae bacterium]
MYRWDFDGLAREQFASLSPGGQAELTAFMDAAILVDPMEYQSHAGEASDPPAPLRMLHSGQHHEGLVTFLVYPPDDLVRIVRLQWRLGG